MTPEQTELARRWIAALGDKAWAPGMLARDPDHGYRSVRVLGMADPMHTDGVMMPKKQGFVVDYQMRPGEPPPLPSGRAWVPDFDDDATKGAALGVLRRLYGRHVWIDYDHRKHRSEPPTFEVFADDGDFACSFLGGGASEAEALVKAAEHWRKLNP